MINVRTEIIAILCISIIAGAFLGALGKQKIKQNKTIHDQEIVEKKINSISLSFVGDVTPTKEFPDLFGFVKDELSKPDLMIGNLEGAITDIEKNKCGTIVTGKCYAFSGNEGFVQILKNASFDMVNVANNHSYDFGEEGFFDTLKNLNNYDIDAIGAKNTIIEKKINGIRISFVGFSTGVLTNDLNKEDTVKTIIERAKINSDLVVVLFHGGAEGIGATHVLNTKEKYLGEERGNVQSFAKIAVDSGADVVVGSGPHVLRGMEWYKGKLIAYSLGNFAGYNTFSTEGILGDSGILTINIENKNQIIDANFVPISINKSGVPIIDWANTSISQVNTLSKEDFKENGIMFDEFGKTTNKNI
jgi:poly-gamma-glutamate capsule biosynthesis protein CapA/YwtB (metallophosphatase superfamily)